MMVRKSENKDISRLNTFGMKVRAAMFIEYDCPEDMLRIDWESLPQPILPVGECSNLLFTGDFRGTLLRSRVDGIHVDEGRSGGNEVFVRVGSGVGMDEFCQWAALKGLWGPENLSGIPGTVGASAVQNVGAYGVEACDVIDLVECFDIQDRTFVSFTNEECAFGYRDSFFKQNRGRYVILEVVYRLSGDFLPRLDYGNLRSEVDRNVELSMPASDPYRPLFGTGLGSQMPLSSMLVRDTVKAIRETKLPNPDKVGSAGSFFKNPVVEKAVFDRVEAVASGLGSGAVVPHFDLPDGKVKIPAAWLIDVCGFKGCRRGGAAVWEKQPLVIVNATGRAVPEEILSLEKEIVTRVFETFGVKLSPEVDHIG